MLGVVLLFETLPPRPAGPHPGTRSSAWCSTWRFLLALDLSGTCCFASAYAAAAPGRAATPPGLYYGHWDPLCCACVACFRWRRRSGGPGRRDLPAAADGEDRARRRRVDAVRAAGSGDGGDAARRLVCWRAAAIGARGRRSCPRIGGPAPPVGLPFALLLVVAGLVAAGALPHFGPAPTPPAAPSRWRVLSAVRWPALAQHESGVRRRLQPLLAGEGRPRCRAGGAARLQRHARAAPHAATTARPGSARHLRVQGASGEPGPSCVKATGRCRKGCTAWCC